MKNVSLYLSIVLLIAVGVLYYLHFAGSNISDDTSSEVIKNKQQNSNSASLPIAFINSDSLMLNYNLALDLNDELVASQDEVRAKFDSKAKSFQKKLASYQEKAQRGAFLSAQSQAMQEKSLQKDQQELQTFEQQLSNKLMIMQQNMNKQLMDSIVSYINDYNKVANYEAIFGVKPLVCNSALDITSTILDGLNDRYKNNKPTEEK